MYCIPIVICILDRDLYYSSNLADQVHQGMEGIQYLDYKVLAQMLSETGDEKFNI